MGKRGVVYVVTKNPNKLREIALVLGKQGFEAVQFNAEKVEIQADELESIVRYAAHRLLGAVPEPFIVEDSGLFIDALKGFPGPYSSYVHRTIGCAGILKLLEGEQNRRARFVCVAAVGMRREIRVFTGEVGGTIAHRARGSSGFGFDPIFIPDGFAETFAEMSIEDKCRISHRGKAVEAIANYLTTNWPQK